MTPRITKAQLEERNANLEDENFSLRLPLERGETAPTHPNARPVIAVEHDRNRPLGTPSENYTEVFFFCRARADGGVVWLREVVPTHNGPRIHLTAMNGCRFDRFCDDRARLGFYEWRSAQYKVSALTVEALGSDPT